MRIHHLNCVTMCPPCRPLFNGDGSWRAPGQLVGHCLLIELASSLVLIDTGLGLADLRDLEGRLGRLFKHVFRPQLHPDHTAFEQVRRLGFEPKDVRDIVLTHLDADHAGGLADFPWARVHVASAEYQAAVSPRTFFEQQRYRPVHWAHNPTWALWEPGGDTWQGFSGVRSLWPDEPQILLVPLIGHSRGHAGVAVAGESGWILHAGDAYYHHAQLAEAPSCPPLLKLFQFIGQADAANRLRNQVQLRALAKSGEARVFCSHDATEFGRFAL